MISNCFFLTRSSCSFAYCLVVVAAAACSACQSESRLWATFETVRRNVEIGVADAAVVDGSGVD